MNIYDAVIIIVLIIGILGGIKNGMIKSLIGLIGIIIVLVLSFYLKNPIAEILYNNLPFFEFKIFKGVTVLNVLFYETVSFVIVFTLLLVFLKIILKISGIVQKLLDATIVLGLGSRIIGMIISFLEAYIIVFVVLFFLNQPFFIIKDLKSGVISNFILNNTPVLPSLLEKQIDAMDELFELKNIYDNTKDIDEYNYKTLDILLKYNIITIDSVKTLRSKNKLDFKNVNELILNYGG